MTFYNGVVCEMDSEFVKIFDCKTQTHHILPTLDDVDLGKHYHFENNKATPIKFCFDNLFSFFVMPNGEVGVKVWAVRPDVLKLPRELRKKFSGKVWNAYLGYLNDPKGMFIEKFKGEEYGGVTVQYAPKNGNFFEIVHVEELNREPRGAMKSKPWDQEQETGHEQVQGNVPDHNNMNNDQLNTSKWDATSICIATNVRNHAYNPLQNGSKRRCDLFFNRRYGVFRYLGDNAKRAAWYNHRVNDSRKQNWKKAPKEGTRTNIYHSLTATRIAEIEEGPLRARWSAEHQCVQIMTKFILGDDVLKNKEGHFWDGYLGRVEIDQKVADSMIETIETRQLDSAQTESVKSERIQVTVLCQPRLDYIDSIDEYPNRGIFEVIHVEKIEYGRESDLAIIES